MFISRQSKATWLWWISDNIPHHAIKAFWIQLPHSHNNPVRSCLREEARWVEKRSCKKSHGSQEQPCPTDHNHFEGSRCSICGQSCRAPLPQEIVFRIAWYDWNIRIIRDDFKGYIKKTSDCSISKPSDSSSCKTSILVQFVNPGETLD